MRKTFSGGVQSFITSPPGYRLAGKESLGPARLLASARRIPGSDYAL
jgi:hypothetical protein